MRPTLANILDATLAHLHISHTDWYAMDRGRSSKVVKVKQIVSLIAFEYWYRHSEIASFLICHRTTVIHYIKVSQNYYRLYDDYWQTVEEIKEALRHSGKEQTIHIIHGWLARSKRGVLTISPNKPEDYGLFWISEGCRPYPNQDCFPQIDYETGPVKVKIRITIDKDEKM